MKYSFAKFLNPKVLVGELNKMPPLHTQIMDLIYPESVQVNHPFSTIGYEDLPQAIKNIPLVSRGSSSYALPLDGNKLRFIEPQNLTPSHFVSAAKLNDVRNLDVVGQQQFLNNKADLLRQATRASKEAMSIQSLDGKITYDLRNANGAIEKYTVDFGNIQTETVSAKWDASGTKASGVIKDIGKMISKIKAKSNATKFIGLMGWDVFAAITDLVNNASTKLPIEVKEDSVVIGSVTLYVTSASYYDYTSKQNVPAVAAKKIKIIGVDAGFRFYNCALDSVEEGFTALPFAIREVHKDDPEGINLIGQSRPMPIPDVNAICEATVLQ